MKRKNHKIIIADDNNFFADALESYLNQDEELEVIATCNTLEETIKQTNTLTFDLLVLDLSFRGQKSIDFIEQIKANNTPFKIICLTSYSNKIIEHEAIESGVDEFIGKDESLENFPSVIKEILNRKRRKSIKNNKKNNKHELTIRQIDIIKACFEFSTEKEIANFLGISINTLKTHKQHLFNKTGAKNNVDLVKYGIEEGIIVV